MFSSQGFMKQNSCLINCAFARSLDKNFFVADIITIRIISEEIMWLQLQLAKIYALCKTRIQIWIIC